MSERQTVTINGRLYDVLTGLPTTNNHTADTIPDKSYSNPVATHTATQIHATMQRSQTLNRRVIQKPAIAPTVAKLDAAPVAHVAQRRVASQVVQKSPSISRFAPHPQAAPRQNRRVMSDIGPVKHPNVVKAHQIQETKKVAQQAPTSVHAPKLSQIIKQEAIAAALDKAPTKKQQKAPKKQSLFARHPRLFSVASASFAVLLLGGYFTYLNMPSLSVRVAAAQAGIGATYPDYQPDGYSLNGPVAAADGEVSMKFASNSGPQNFVVTQSKSSWDSSAVVNNLVIPASDNSYVTTNERGLTIYTFNGNAAWVNGGILYTIEGDAPLSGEQIRRIATSL